MQLNRSRHWLGLSLALTLAYAIVPLSQAFRGEFVVDSDARQHVFWMARFLDPGLFPNDWIADYHQFVAPWGYAQLYRLAAIAGIEPFTFNKLLPAVLAAFAAFYVFRFCRALGSSPAAAFLATLLLNQTLWARYDITTGTARSFIYPLFAAFLFCLARRQATGVAIAVVLQGLFYPQCVLVSCGVLGLHGARSLLPPTKSATDRCRTLSVRVAIAGLLAGFVVLLPYALQASPFDPAIDATTARQMVEFQPGGRVEFFHTNPIEFFLHGKRSSLMPKITCVPPWIWLGALLPISLWWSDRRGLRLNLDVDRQQLGILAEVAIASVGLFGIAHLVLFRIHHPSRYTMHSLLVVLAVAASVSIAPMLQALYDRLRRKTDNRRVALLLVASLAIVAPASSQQYNLKYRQGAAPELYAYLQAQPREALTATLSRLGNDIPSHAQRPVLASVMFAMPYHLGYYRELQSRVEATLAAQYTDDPQVFAKTVADRGIDFWLLDRAAFSPGYLEAQDWLLPFSGQDAAIGRDGSPVLERARDRCTVVAGETWQLVDAACVVGNTKSESP